MPARPCLIVLNTRPSRNHHVGKRVWRLIAQRNVDNGFIPLGSKALKRRFALACQPDMRRAGPVIDHFCLAPAEPGDTRLAQRLVNSFLGSEPLGEIERGRPACRGFGAFGVGEDPVKKTVAKPFNRLATVFLTGSSPTPNAPNPRHAGRPRSISPSGSLLRKLFTRR